jgi:hypothetical protein
VTFTVPVNVGMRAAPRGWRRSRLIQVLRDAADWHDMRVSSSPAAAAVERVMIVLNKEQDVAKAEGQALLSLIDAAPGVGGRISVYA